MMSLRVHRFFKLLGICTVLGLASGGLTACAAWFQGDSSQSESYPEEAEVTEITELPGEEGSVAKLGDLTRFINSEQAAEMMNTEPLKSRVAALVRKDSDGFNASREVLLPVTQIMEGYILSEGHSTLKDKRSLVLIDSDRDIVMVVWVDVGAKTYKMLEKFFPDRDPQVITEMEEYANNWGLGQLGMAQ